MRSTGISEMPCKRPPRRRQSLILRASCCLIASWVALGSMPAKITSECTEGWAAFSISPTSHHARGMGVQARHSGLTRRHSITATALPDNQGAQSQRPSHLKPRRWRRWLSAGVATISTLWSAAPAWARSAPRYATRQQEQTAQLITVGVIIVAFIIAYKNSKKEDRSEEQRIKAEVSRLVTLKKEFEEQEEEQQSDDEMAAALRKAQQKMAEDKKKEEEEEGKKTDGEAGGGSEEGKSDGGDGDGKDTGKGGKDTKDK